MNHEKKKPVGDHGHDENEWGIRDDSEKIEWEEHYENRNKKWMRLSVGILLSALGIWAIARVV